MNHVRSGMKQHSVKPPVCRKGAWAELTVPVTSVDSCTTSGARFYDENCFRQHILYVTHITCNT